MLHWESLTLTVIGPQSNTEKSYRAYTSWEVLYTISLFILGRLYPRCLCTQWPQHRTWAIIWFHKVHSTSMDRLLIGSHWTSHEKLNITSKSRHITTLGKPTENPSYNWILFSPIKWSGYYDFDFVPHIERTYLSVRYRKYDLLGLKQYFYSQLSTDDI